MGNQIGDFDRDMLFLAIATENLKKYGVLGFSSVVRGGYQLHLRQGAFEELAVGREIMERKKNDPKYSDEKYFTVHGIEAMALYDNPEPETDNE